MRSIAFASGLSGLFAIVAAAGCGSVTATTDGGGGAGGGAGGATTGAAGTTGAGGTTGTAGTGGGTGSCAFAAKYTLIDGGGLAATQDTETLTPPNLFHIERQTFIQPDAGRLSCDPPMPDCNDPTRIDMWDVEAAISHPDVQAALALTMQPFFGNMGIADGPAFAFRRADGRGFTAGINCDTPSATCKPIPPGIGALVELLRGLIRQQRMHPSCNLLN
jgi:hypothetical protein